MARKSVMLTIKLKNQVISLTPKQAQKVYRALGEIFSGSQEPKEKDAPTLPLPFTDRKEGKHAQG